jgi:hypothetical protein
MPPATSAAPEDSARRTALIGAALGLVVLVSTLIVGTVTARLRRVPSD